MSRSPMIVHTVPALRRTLDNLRARKATTALVVQDGPVRILVAAKIGTTRPIDNVAV